MSVTLNKALNDKIRVSNLGTTRTGMEAVVQSIVDRVLQGDSKGIPELMRLFNKAKVFKPVPNPTRLTGVVVEPAAYRRDKELGTQKGYYPVGDGLARGSPAILAVVVKANAIWGPCWWKFSVRP
jgi:hypothetical protein